jgi:hypothetical protein
VRADRRADPLGVAPGGNHCVPSSKGSLGDVDGHPAPRTVREFSNQEAAGWCGSWGATPARWWDHGAMTDAPAAESSGRHEQVVELRKEAYTMALYVAICLLAAFAALPETDAHAHAKGIIWGVTVGLAVAHWFAFRVSARLVGAGSVRPHDVESGGAQLVGAAGVALVASAPVILFPQSVELELVELLLAAFIALIGFTVARGGGATRARALVYALSVLVVAVAIALVKNGLAGH